MHTQQEQNILHSIININSIGCSGVLVERQRVWAQTDGSRVWIYTCSIVARGSFIFYYIACMLFGPVYPAIISAERASDYIISWCYNFALKYVPVFTTPGIFTTIEVIFIIWDMLLYTPKEWGPNTLLMSPPKINTLHPVEGCQFSFTISITSVMDVFSHGFIIWLLCRS